MKSFITSGPDQSAGLTYNLVRNAVVRLIWYCFVSVDNDSFALISYFYDVSHDT